ncbi:MAG: Isoquinoline 1-oxidoreductase subunit [Woeseiaceae bacterium]
MTRAIALGIAGTLLIANPGTASPPATSPPTTLRPVSAFASIANKQERSLALFQEAGKVILHPRCVNCHPRNDRPLQTDAGRPHQPLVVRGADGHGAPGMECSTCHHDANFDPARVPGHPRWHLAPLSMAWQGKLLGPVCEQIKDPARNGNMDLNAIAHHMAEDSLVGTAWNPGAGRTPAPGTQAEFGALIRAWIDAGAACPVK